MATLPSKVPNPRGFWNIMKSVSVAEIAKEAHRPISVAVIGSQDRREEAILALYGTDLPGALSDPPYARALPEQPFVQGYEAMTTAAQFPREPGIYDFVIDVGGGREGAPDGTLVYAVSELGGWESTLERILDDQPTLILPLARNFPVFRRRVAQRLITQTATVNAQFSLITGIVEQIPLMGWIGLPGTALSDIIVLTKNQVMLALRLAAVYGLEVGPSRLKELAPIIANGFGWRAVARELVGAVPVIGFIPRAAIAYAGTATIGKAAQLYYETGEEVTSAQLRRLYRDAYSGARERVRTLAANMRRDGRGGGTKAIAATHVNAIDRTVDELPGKLETDEMPVAASESRQE